MLIAIFAADENDTATLIPWGIRFAHANHGNLLVVCGKRSKGKQKWKDIRLPAEPDENPITRAIQDAIQTFPDDLIAPPEPTSSTQPPAEQPESSADDMPHQVHIQIRELNAPFPERVFTDSMQNLDIGLLLVPAHEPSKSNRAEDNWEQHLMRHASCETMILRGRPPTGNQPLSILVVTTGDDETDIALIRSLQLAGRAPALVSILFVSRQSEQISDDINIETKVAERQFQRLLQNMKAETQDMQKTVVIDDNLSSAIEKHCRANPVDLVIIGTRNLKKIEKLLHATDAGKSSYALGAVREADPLAHRLWKNFRHWVRQRVPQLQRDGRIRLVEWLQNSSRFDFDFIALIALSTLIATLGLIRNSASVVIGAMLVAPLMTPLIGVGFALVQGNEKLIRNAAYSTCFGFALAFGLAIVTSWCVPEILIQSEMLSRGAPDMLDLIVAFLSGIAAAYAMGRPNLISALPGVVIAAALVPPVATSGIALGLWVEGLIWSEAASTVADRLDLAIGSMLLFLTNIVAITLGTAVVFWAVGIDSRVESKPEDTRPGRIWPRYWFIGFVVLSLLLAGLMTWRNGIHRAHEREEQTAKPAVLAPESPQIESID